MTKVQVKDSRIINIGILAHVDAGKTTITENILYLSGGTKKIGSVDKGTSITDSLEVEKERGISVKSSSVSINWKDTRINIIDTPGHIDFSAEVDRTLLALDCAILVISAVEGIQAHSENLWDALKKLKIPVLIFINKIDRDGADTNFIIDEIKKELDGNILPLQTITNESTKDIKLDNSIFDNIIKETETRLPTNIFEQIISTDDNITEKYINEDEITHAELISTFKRAIAGGRLFPVLFGSAKFNIGIRELLDSIVSILPEAIISMDSKETRDFFSGVVYRVENDKTLGKLASVRLFDGEIRSRDLVKYGRNSYEAKVTQIKKVFTNKLENQDIVKAGDTAVLCGLDKVVAGDIIGTPKGKKILEKLDLFKSTGLSNPLLTVKIEPKNSPDYSTLVAALKELSDEDPALSFLWLKEERELHIKIMGKIHIEILENVLSNRFEIDTIFGDPIVIYKETPSKIGEGYEEYTMPKPCWGVVRFRIEPLENGKGVIYKSEVNVDKIAAKYQNEIEETIFNAALNQGIYGWEVTDLKITLIDGEDHVIHSRPGDFKLATKLAIMDGLLNSTGSKLLEPFLSFKISANEESSGKIISSLISIRGEISTTNVVNDAIIIDGKIPVATSLDYLNTLNSITSGKGKFKSSFIGYREVSIDEGKIMEYRGVSPKDRSKYILKHRGAIK